jgi:hypothetical protein
MNDTLREYFDALERLENGTPKIVSKGTSISNDSVSLEAGRKKGTIKKSRPVFSELIEAIDKASNTQVKPTNELLPRLANAKTEIARYRLLWEEALAREISLVKQFWAEREAWAQERAALSENNVSQIKIIKTD